MHPVCILFPPGGRNQTQRTVLGVNESNIKPSLLFVAAESHSHVPTLSSLKLKFPVFGDGAQNFLEELVVYFHH